MDSWKIKDRAIATWYANHILETIAIVRGYSLKCYLSLIAPISTFVYLSLFLHLKPIDNITFSITIDIKDYPLNIPLPTISKIFLQLQTNDNHSAST